MYYKSIRLQFLVMSSLLAIISLNAQNLVRNPNFTELDSCPYTFGQIYFANHWNSDNDQSPDLFDSCVTGPFYDLPINFTCTTVTPYQDNGFVGIVTFGRLPDGNNIREIMTARLDAELPLGVDIYCSMVVRPLPRCELPDNIATYTCYSSGIGLAIIYESQQREIVFQAPTPVDNIDEWTILKGCYEAKGEEERVQIQNFSDNSQTESDCLFIDERFNISYTYVDNIVVAPFDILPDTLLVCDVEEMQFQGIDFYNLPLFWDDGAQQGARFFERSGSYNLMADAENCILEEPVFVFVADPEVILLEDTVNKCESEPLTLTVEIPGEVLWSNGQRGSSIRVLTAGVYIANVETTCSTLEYIYTVQEVDCNEVLYAANVFSPNGDGVNDEIQFYLNPMLTIDGMVRIFDRWGTLVFQASLTEGLTWNGRSSIGTDLTQAVYVWTFVSADKSIKQSGNITLIR